MADVKDIKDLESQLRWSAKMEAVGTLAGGISHEFNNILQVIRGYAQILLVNRKHGDEGYYELKEIESAAIKAAGLTSQLLTFSQATESHPRPIDLNDEVRSIKKILRS